VCGASDCSCQSKANWFLLFHTPTQKKVKKIPLDKKENFFNTLYINFHPPLLCECMTLLRYIAETQKSILF
jgi:hypothetical protein